MFIFTHFSEKKCVFLAFSEAAFRFHQRFIRVSAVLSKKAVLLYVFYRFYQVSFRELRVGEARGRRGRGARLQTSPSSYACDDAWGGGGNAEGVSPNDACNWLSTIWHYIFGEIEVQGWHTPKP